MQNQSSTRACILCGEDFTATLTHHRYCSVECRDKAAAQRHREKARQGVHTKRQCAECSATFTPRRYDQLCCSQKCRQKHASRGVRERIRGAGLTCSYPGCSKIRETVAEGGLCPMHKVRKQRGQPMDAPQNRVPKSEHRPCSVDGCERRYYAADLCSLHYNRFREDGDIGPTDITRRPNGAGTLTKDSRGYVYVTTIVAGKQVRRLQHRIVMEQMLGRPLCREESVHHKNGIREDNRPENLEIFAGRHPKGQRVVDLVAYVVETYPDAVAALLRGEQLPPDLS